MFIFLLIVHLIICLALIAVVLVQSGKGGGLAGGTFGGTAQTVFGGRGATDFITRATMVLGIAFFLTSITLALVQTNSATSSRSLLQEEARRARSQAPVNPTAPAGGSPVAPAPAPAPAGGAPTTPVPAPAGGGR